MQTSKDYSLNFKVANSDYGIITIPKGTPLTHQTAMGIDEKYHFVANTSWIKPHENGVIQYGLIHDINYYGIDVPKEYVEY